ncbi:class I SAM-dependent methyltransferase [bacterium]|nr:MAG: class I SAM-dependent methyltransferase [bacterium]
MTEIPHEAGKSSIDLIDFEIFYSSLPLAPGMEVLDLGCGSGSYALRLAGRLGPLSVVRGFDLWSEGVEKLNRTASELGLTNVRAETADLSGLSAVRDGEADLALMATVLHDLTARGTGQGALGEAVRALRKGGWLALVEFKKIDSRPGPPLEIRLSPEDLLRLTAPFGLAPGKVVELGTSTYLMLFQKP